MTAEQFFREYCERSHRTVKEMVATGFIAGPCVCDYENCHGYGMYSGQKALDAWVELHGVDEGHADQWPPRTPVMTT